MKLPSFFLRNSILLLALASLAGFSCQKAPKKPETPLVESPSTSAAAKPVAPLGPPIEVKAPQASKSTSSLIAKPLTSVGESMDGRFSPDGTRIVFVSRARPMHRQAQVYEMHLGLMTEKRVTFHDGDDSGPTYYPEGTQLLFSSATDEIKEDPYVIDRMMKNYHPEGLGKRGKAKADLVEGSEIYRQTLNGRVIERITRSAGFDGDADVDAKSKRVAFSSMRSGSGSTQVWILNGKAQARVTDGKVVDRSPRFAPDGKSLVFSRAAAGAENGDVRLMLAEGADFGKTRALTTGPGSDLHPSWHPSGDEIVFASNREGKTFHLFTIDRAGTCLRRLSDVDFDQLQPVFSPDGKRILFTARRNGQHQIFIMDYQRPSECYKTLTPAPSPSPSALNAAPPASTATAAPASAESDQPPSL